MTKILKNQTASPIAIKDTGITIPASGQYEIPPHDYGLWESSTDVQTQIAAGNLIGNTGTRDLDQDLTSHFIKEPHIAETIHFDNQTNGFTAQDVQAAIEELKDSPLPDFLITEDAGLVFTENGDFIFKG